MDRMFISPAPKTYFTKVSIELNRVRVKNCKSDKDDGRGLEHVYSSNAASGGCSHRSFSLTRDLIDTQRSQDVGDEKTEESPDSAPTPSVSSNIMAVKHWQVGEPCQAQSNNSYQEAVIEEISTNGEVSVKFRGNIKNLKNRKELLAKQKDI
ncbi:unnamed protein product [Lepeophtheirus salmonis]|uniref:(salmon louse) hypothetical protein n=1 Tax=Lepeophtheirus salmonis TaxID=72036 RepID=A0A7R8CNN4_LEPSM|nr:unnamed protein product [Lepeophtheirus salmonis]CAF2873978.1 unnamed protein product [Lepeophtheirus salmonis]